MKIDVSKLAFCEGIWILDLHLTEQCSASVFSALWSSNINPDHAKTYQEAILWALQNGVEESQ